MSHDRKLSEEIACTATGNVSNVDKPMGETKKKTYKERNIEDGVGGPEGRKILSFKEWIEDKFTTKEQT